MIAVPSRVGAERIRGGQSVKSRAVLRDIKSCALSSTRYAEHLEGIPEFPQRQSAFGLGLDSCFTFLLIKSAKLVYPLEEFLLRGLDRIEFLISELHHLGAVTPGDQTQADAKYN